MKNVLAAIEEIKSGKMVIIVDDNDRENEGDLVCAASTVTPEQINFMAKYARGIICLSLTEDQIERLSLPMMHKDGNVSHFDTAFTYSIDARKGVTTGVSAYERALTIRLAVDPKSTLDDFVVPGHVFPLKSKSNGVLERRGHTEASVDLTRLAGIIPGGVICEIMNEDGTMMRGKDLDVFAKQHGMLVVSVKEIVDYRLSLIAEAKAESTITTRWGDLNIRVYHCNEGKEHVAIWMGDLSSGNPLVRIHSECFTGDVLESLNCDCHSQLKKSLDLISNNGCGLVVYLRQEGRGIGLAEKLKAYALQRSGIDTVEANRILGHKDDHREYDIAVCILKDLGVSSVRLITNNPKKFDSVKSAFDKCERVEVDACVYESNKNYIKTKIEKMGHMIKISEIQ